MYSLIDQCEAAIMMPGGVGTLAELAVMWNEEIISSNDARLMVLVGKGWKKVIDVFLEESREFIKPHDQKRVCFAPDINAAVDLINQFDKENKKSS